MFRVRASEVQAQIPKTAAIVLVMLLLAFALSVAAALQVYAEYHLLGEWGTRQGTVSSAEIGALRRDIGTRIIVRSTASAILLLCTLAMIWLQQRQLAILRVLYQVKLLSLEILASMDQGVITVDLNVAVTGINSAAVRILGLDSDCIGRPLESISSGGLPLVDLAGRVAQRQAPVWDQDFALDRGGRVRRIRADAHVLKDSAEKAVGCIILLRDVSDRVLMEERVHLMERFVSLGTLAAGLHHEIKNPLTALSIHVQLLEKRLDGLTPRKPVDELMGVVKSEINRLNGVLDSFRDFASLHRLSLRPTDVLELLEDTMRLIGPQAAQHHVEVTLRHPGAALARVSLDSDKFKQAVLNLVLNALEAMPEGGSLGLAASLREGELRVEVSDTGPGIAPEIRQELFKPYFSTKSRGTGMGLALSEKVVSQHGGRIEYRTGPLGTTFSIAIPLEPASGTEDQP
jgi:two-component system sensor histidine kinase HydH